MGLMFQEFFIFISFTYSVLWGHTQTPRLSPFSASHSPHTGNELLLISKLACATYRSWRQFSLKITIHTFVKVEFPYFFFLSFLLSFAASPLIRLNIIWGYNIDKTWLPSMRFLVLELTDKKQNHKNFHPKINLWIRDSFSVAPILIINIQFVVNMKKKFSTKPFARFHPFATPNSLQRNENHHIASHHCHCYCIEMENCSVYRMKIIIFS